MMPFDLGTSLAQYAEKVEQYETSVDEQKLRAQIATLDAKIPHYEATQKRQQCQLRFKCSQLGMILVFVQPNY